MKNNILLTVIAMAILSVACKEHKETDHEYHSITDKIEAKSKEYNGVSLSSEPYHDHIQKLEVTENGETFLIPERKSQIKSFACTECHSKPLHQLQNENIGKKAHWDIKLSHADDATMDCKTCHNPNNMDNLKSITEMPIDFNQSYKLCSQCHTKQFDDWAGGAHGKKVGGWAPPRASLTCVNCHNPHKPHFESKWPARFNTQIIKERE